MANEIEILGSAAAPQGFPAGWVLNDERPAGKGRTLYCWEGPASTVAAAFEAAYAAHPSKNYAVSRSPGGAKATISVTVGGSGSETDGSGETPETYDTPVKVSDDTWQLQPTAESVDLAAHPRFAAVGGATLAAIDDALAAGDKAAQEALAAASAEAAAYLALRRAGVRSYMAVGYSYRYEQHFSRAGFAGMRRWTAAGIRSGGRVYPWGSVMGASANSAGHVDSDPPFGEPKWQDQEGAEHSYEWRLDGVAVGCAGDEVTVSYAYTGAWKWAKALYKGGSWEPGA